MVDRLIFGILMVNLVAYSPQSWTEMVMSEFCSIFGILMVNLVAYSPQSRTEMGEFCPYWDTPMFHIIFAKMMYSFIKDKKKKLFELFHKSANGRCLF